MRSLLALVLVLAVGVALAACGGARRASGPSGRNAADQSSSYMNTPQAKLGGATPALAAALRRELLEKVAWVRSTAQPHLRNDGDDEEPGDEDHDNNHDTGTGTGSIDPYVDYLPPANNRAYHDEDDEQSLKFGHAASAEGTQVATALVKRYYAMAAAGSGAGACSMFAPSLLRSVPLDYGKLGSSYLHGAKTCAGVLTLMFKRFHRELSGTVQVTDVRMSGSTALAFIGSKTMNASVISLRRVGDAWTVSQLLGTTLQ